MKDPTPEIVAALARQDIGRALALAAADKHTQEHREVITRAWSAYLHPVFYQQIGKDPDQLINVGLAAVRSRYEGRS